jgi:hypothetical protein
MIMTEKQPKPLVQRLLIKTGMCVAILNAPPDYQIGELPDEITLTHNPEPKQDVVQLFVANINDLNAHFVGAMRALKEGGILWLCYPKKGSALASDLHRDSEWKIVDEADWLPVTQISIDETWSALRFRPRTEIKKLTRKF